MGGKVQCSAVPVVVLGATGGCWELAVMAEELPVAPGAVTSPCVVSLSAAGVPMTMGRLWMAPINWER